MKKILRYRENAAFYQQQNSLSTDELEEVMVCWELLYACSRMKKINSLIKNIKKTIFPVMWHAS